ncbi:COG4223 family protein [Albimonas pacifica]|uniref:Inner membrane protein n=1 Tax=Albimonas pacifica TaxID=1114924 RepID=A0A1I3MDB2_9RHOB|nr:hypothetical protein [Albimonas pacifica]SFI94937.1 hypothetical protein SAMN05216258_11151 [Albimonas pacifica]
MSDKTDPDQTPAKGKTPDGATEATETETPSVDPADAPPRPDEIEDAATADEPSVDPRPEEMTAEEAELAAARPGVDPDTIPGDETVHPDAAEAGLDPIASTELREAQDAERPQAERPDEDFPHGDGSTWPEGRPDELAAGLDYDDREASREERAAPVEDDPFHDEHDEHARTSLAARALQALVILLLGAAIALWALPRVAPWLPAPIAEAVQAPGVITEAELTAMRAEIEEANATRFAALEARLAEAGAAAGAEGLSALETRVAELESRLEALGAAPGDGSGLSQQVEDLAAAQSNLRAQLDSLSGSLSNLGEEAGNLPPEAAERLSGFAAATEALRAEMGSISGRVDALAARLDEAEARFDERASAAESAAQEARTQAADAERRAQVNAAFAELTLSLDEGRPYAGPLNALADFGPAPEALAGPADAGVARLADLRESFTAAAHDAMEAQATEEAGESVAAQTLAALRARLQGVPVDRVEGEGLDAQLGAAAAALREGELAAALEALEGLPPAAGEAMAPWTERARARLAAMTAAQAWRAELLGGN